MLADKNISRMIGKVKPKVIHLFKKKEEEKKKRKKKEKKRQRFPRKYLKKCD